MRGEAFDPLDGLFPFDPFSWRNLSSRFPDRI